LQQADALRKRPRGGPGGELVIPCRRLLWC